ncbi:hypothetical protein [Bradyrhizobium sp. NP1]|uniref:hypothetical protein n=1 Tax=Bradyrhizobium sp. NP1 TaxID=3049772 RepID=UPI0025A64B77|nr:hypothetical protein [Bradyrhizobium sp. NP1]WJR78772.1 hypothetical protein QOU61_02885 [Bradyrhizobium sp. NP1]
MNEVAERDTGGRWLPGFTPNPSGRPKIVEEIKSLARQHAPEAFKRVCELVGSEDERTALAAAQEILNRAYGRPTQAIEQTVEYPDIKQLYLQAVQLANGHNAKVVEGRTIDGEIEW